MRSSFSPWISRRGMELSPAPGVLVWIYPVQGCRPQHPQLGRVARPGLAGEQRGMPTLGMTGEKDAVRGDRRIDAMNAIAEPQRRARAVQYAKCRSLSHKVGV